MDDNESRLKEQHHFFHMFFRKLNTISIRDGLYQLIDKKNLIGCEIGIAYGYHSLAMLKYLDIKKLYLIDSYTDDDGFYPENTRKIMQKKLKPFWNRIEFHFLYSDDAHKFIQDNSLDFVYIDGCHSYEQVKKDIINYSKKLKKGGLLCGHNFESIGVSKAVNECLKNFKTSYYPVDWWKVKE